MSSQPLGENTSKVEVTNVSSHGLWLLTHKEELFMSYADFPWFKEALLKNVLHVEEPHPGHYYWPELDIDLTEEIIKNPEQFPLKAK